jgi:hypothetical protein
LEMTRWKPATPSCRRPHVRRPAAGRRIRRRTTTDASGSRRCAQRPANHEVGHAVGLDLPGIRPLLAVRRGDWWRRVMKRVYLPIRPDLVVRISSAMPAEARVRSGGGHEPQAFAPAHPGAMWLWRLRGQPSRGSALRPLEPADASTIRSRRVAPLRVRRPAIWTIGNGEVLHSLGCACRRADRSLRRPTMTRTPPESLGSS